MQPGDRLVCTFVENQIIGTRFQTWLLHLTIVPWFRLSDSSGMIMRGLARALTTLHPFTVTTGGIDMFGPHKSRPVRLLQPSLELVTIEARVRNYLHKKHAWLVDEATKVRQEFRPHITHQGQDMVAANRTFTCDRLYIVEQKGAYKEIAGEVILGKATA